jgi:TonB family protein
MPPRGPAVVTVRAQAVALPLDDGHSDEGGHGSSGHSDGAGLGQGKGTGLGESGLGGEGNGPGGLGMPLVRERSAGKSERAKKPGPEEGLDEGDFGSDDPEVVGSPLPGRPARISMDHAAYLRTYEIFPSPLPDSCWPPGRVANSMLVEICVSERGEVTDVVVRQSAGNDADSFLINAIRSWRYRPRLVMGSARPFCHPIRIVYKRELPFNRRW